MQHFSDEWIAGLLKAAGDGGTADCAKEKFREDFYKQRQAEFKKHFPARPVARVRFLKPGRFSHFVQGGMLASVAVVLCAAGSNRVDAPAPQTVSVANNSSDKALYSADRFTASGTAAEYRMLPVNLSDLPRFRASCPVQRMP